MATEPPPCTSSLCGVRLDSVASSGCGSAPPCVSLLPGLSQDWITGSHARSQTARRPDQLLHSFQRRRRPPASDWLSAPVGELSHGQRVLTAGQPLLVTTGGEGEDEQGGSVTDRKSAGLLANFDQRSSICRKINSLSKSKTFVEKKSVTRGRIHEKHFKYKKD